MGEKEAQLTEKLHLSAKGLLRGVREVFTKATQKSEKKRGKERVISYADCLMSGLAMFKLKMSSLLQFDQQSRVTPVKENIENLFGVKKVPCDTYMREQLDQFDPKAIRPAFKRVFSALQRGKKLEKYAFLGSKYLLLSDGTGYFSSQNVHCKNCCEKKHRDGSITYYHHFLGAVIAHPDHKEVIPICPEPIMKEDGKAKNDCERNATERLLKDLRREHPHLPVILVEDALAANGPHILLLKQLDMSFITVVKQDGNKALFEWVNGFNWEETGKQDLSQGVYSFEKDGEMHRFRFVNGVPLNDTHKTLKVNFLEYWGPSKRGKGYHNTWITDIKITQENVYDIARGGRTRWHIENETFNTLKNQGYNFEHNYGHGYENLSTVLAMLMMLAFAIDQAEQMCCQLFKQALIAQGRKLYLWDRIRSFFTTHIILSWRDLYMVLIQGKDRKNIPILDSS